MMHMDFCRGQKKRPEIILTRKDEAVSHLYLSLCSSVGLPKFLLILYEKCGLEMFGAPPLSTLQYFSLF